MYLASMAVCVVALANIAGLREDTPPTQYARPELLIEASELRQQAATARFRILDARGKSKYLSGHVPGAVWVDQESWSRAFASGQDADHWSRRIGELAINGDTPVVVYDDGSVKDAARIWWILRYWGIPDVRLLNGGWQSWQSAGGKVATDATRVETQVDKLRPLADRLATKEQVLAWLADNEHQIIDTRSQAEHCGTQRTAKRNGAIPGSIHLDWVDLLDKDKRFKSPAELSILFQEAGIRLDRPAVTHCQSGGRAAVMAFAMELMGAKEVRNYYKSWAEWGNAEDTPIVKPQPKK
jgi:thiosulfate/3-mercaptopyruvate sulfurtransferase